MRFVSLNLDVNDVAVVHRIAERALVACPCRALGRRSRCPECEVIANLLADLGSVLDRSAGEGRPARHPRGAAATREVVHPEMAIGLGQEATPQLRVVPGGLVEASR